MRVLLTGGAGYVGSHVVKELLAVGHEVVVLDHLGMGHRRAVPSEVPFEVGDLSDASFVQGEFARYRPQAVLHFAGSTMVGESVTSPGLYFRNNIQSGLNVLDAMVANQVTSIVFSSTAAVYGEPQEVPIPEDHPKLPTNPYGESKLFFEAILRRYDIAHQIRSISLRYFNAAGAHPSGDIGEDHTPETHLIPIMLQAALGQRPHVSIFGTDYPTVDRTCVRDYVHVTDLAAAHVLALDALAGGTPTTAYNLGNGKGFTVRQVIKTAEDVVGNAIPVVTAERRPGDPAVLVASSDRIQAELGWTPKYPNLRTIIETAWRWHSSHPNGYRKENERAN